LDRTLLHDLETTTKALRAAVARAQAGVAGLQNISKLGPAAMTAAVPIIAELRQLETDLRKLTQSYRDQLAKAAQAVTAAEKE
jgi:hypothetical protein